MIVYADILIILNLAVDYFLLALTSGILRLSASLWRCIIASSLGAISSLIIFLPRFNELVLLCVYLVLAFVITAVAFGIHPIKRFLRNTAVFFAVSCAYAGGMLALWSLLRPSGMVINNSVVYFNISPLFLIVFSVISYFAIMLLRRLLEKNAPLAQCCKVKLWADGRTIELDAIADTGNSLEDTFGLSEIIIADKAAACSLLGELEGNPELNRRYRVLPCSTVGGNELLDGYRCDKAYIEHEGKTLEIRRPILAVSKQSLGGDYSAIINPKILN